MTDTEGLRVLKWSMFDSLDSEGSGYKFMEREPVVALDRVCHKYRITPTILLGYTSKPVADKMYLPTNDSHRVGMAVRLQCRHYRKRIKMIRGLMEEGVTRFAMSQDALYFDTDPLKPPAFYYWT